MDKKEKGAPKGSIGIWMEDCVNGTTFGNKTVGMDHGIVDIRGHGNQHIANEIIDRLDVMAQEVISSQPEEKRGGLRSKWEKVKPGIIAIGTDVTAAVISKALGIT